jgi:CheY-like chemotaxis protein
MNNKKALIIEDNKLLCDLLLTVLNPLCSEVECCASGSSAIDLLSLKKFDVVITDYRLPGMNGLDIARMQRRAYPESHIIGMSIEMRENEFLEAGANAFLLKPFTIDEFASCVARAFNNTVQNSVLMKAVIGET